jgi:murein DD-endopeptidase MepM/ murein hydrolase activator NlpD
MQKCVGMVISCDMNERSCADLKIVSLDSEVTRVLGTKGGRVVVCNFDGQSGSESAFSIATLNATLNAPLKTLDAWCSPIVFAGEAEVFDFTKLYDPDRPLTRPYGIGRYDEDRRGMYEASLFTNGPEKRTIHMGIDIGASVGTPVFSPVRATVWGCDYLSQAGDYGGTVILKTVLNFGRETCDLFMLFGHLSRVSVARLSIGSKVEKGELLGWLGEKSENGGWNSHLHWQLSWLEPLKVDLPGAVTESNRALAKKIFPDPTFFLRTAAGGWHQS